MLSAAASPRHALAAVLLSLVIGASTNCRPAPIQQDEFAAHSTAGPPRAAVIAWSEGEKRFLRGGTAPLLLKIDPVTTGSQRMVLGSSDLPPGDEIPVHRHLQEDEIILITRGTARVRLGSNSYTASAGGAVFIPQGTCIAVRNIGTDTLSNVFVFSAPGFERVLRAVSTPAGAPPRLLSPAERASAFHQGHAEAAPSNC